MHLPQVSLPISIPPQKLRDTQDDVPPTLRMRRDISERCVKYIEDHNPVPPMPLSELQEYAEVILKEMDIDVAYNKYTAVIMNNLMWRDALATVPYERRLLLVPKCLRVEETCPAPFDEFGLLCKECGQCSLQDMQAEAEKLGYAVLIAEGSALVMSIIETGKIDAIVGVSCLSVLEKAFPYMESAAIPGIAVPLLQDDCIDTTVDLDTVWDVIHLTSDDKTYRMNLDELRGEVKTWFEPESLEELMGPSDDESDKIAREWLARDGKRWRPFLTACAYKALVDDAVTSGETSPESLKKIAIAVECFHKASLIHDDIEDEDLIRYEQATVHAEHGVAVALNVGDLLLGEGYRLIAECGADAQQIADMMTVASVGHRDLCRGQGAELCWARDPGPLKSTQVLEIFRLKTAPAFEVALRLGAVLGGANEVTHEALHGYSENLGIAYQIRDDMEDWLGSEGTSDEEAMRPTLLPALALEKTKGDDKQLVKTLWSREQLTGPEIEKLRELFGEVGVDHRASELLDIYKDEAVRSLRTVEHATLKGLLRRVMGKIFNDIEIKGWCRESEASHVAGGEVSAESAE
jgi:geranylgeranyl pyrophosphate synthase